MTLKTVSLCGFRRRIGNRRSTAAHFVLFCWLSFLPLGYAGESGGNRPHAGFFYDSFDLTLDSGHRTEALGPLFYSEEKDTQRTWAIPPILSYSQDPGTESKEIDFLYPLLTYDRYGEQYRWQ